MADPATDGSAVGKDFENVPCLMIVEVNQMLQQIMAEKEARRRTNPSEKPLKDVFLSTLMYTQRFNRFRGESAASSLREAMTAKGLTPLEIALMANLVPESVEDARAQIHTLTRLSDADIEDILLQLTRFQRYT
eukprot:c38957_g1_i1.p2 GENE.c38957_g1_i1~~c38957_g1_i1.p2  ORF type:complete len:134 (+),score=35.36 c38957_g1_i1:178-579(+)